jgi:putative ABC transport system substrate-binding protein
MSRREFIALVGSGIAGWPLAARAQQPGKVWRIGWLASIHVPAFRAAFAQGMRELGYTEGKDFIIELRSVEGDYKQIPEVAAELVRLKVDVIVTSLSAALPTLRQAITTIPIVMVYSTDPVGSGLVASLVRPGGNMTGLTSSSDDSSPKQLELLMAVVPNISRIALLGNPNSTTYVPVRKGAQDAAAKAGVSLVPIEARTREEIENAIAALAKERISAAVFASDAVIFQQQHRIAELALANRLATMFSQREYVAAGGLMSYGENLADFWRRAAPYVDKIFKGAKPGDLPIEQPTKFNLVINRKTADALGVTIPAQLYIFADEVIE